jgi:hypothetical protein
MANHNVEILEGGEPRPNTVYLEHGDTVTFSVDGDQSVEVTFNPPYCLTDDAPFELDGSSAPTAQCSPRAVSSIAQKKNYTYSVDVLRAGSVKAQRETKQGNLEVTTDPPKDKDKDKR